MISQLSVSLLLLLVRGIPDHCYDFISSEVTDSCGSSNLTRKGIYWFDFRGIYWCSYL